MMHIVAVLLFLLFQFVPMAAASEKLKAVEQPVILTVEDASKWALANHLGIQISREKDLAEKEEIDIEKAKYDAELSFEFVDSRDKSPSSSVFAPSLSESREYIAGIEKDLTIGTELDFEVETIRMETNSNFVSLNPNYSSQILLDITQPILENSFGLAERKRLQAVRLDTQAFHYESLESIEREVFEVRKLFWEFKRDHRLWQIRKRGLKDALFFLKVTDEKLKLGLLEKPDWLAAKANVKTREIDEKVSRNQFEDTRNEFKSSLAMDWSDELYLKGEIILELPAMKYSQVLKLAMESRYDRLRALAVVEKEDLLLEVSQSELLPRLDVVGSLALNGLGSDFAESIELAWDGREPVYEVGVVWEHPFENTRARAQVRKKKNRQKQAILELKQIEDLVEKEVDEHYRQIHLSYAQLMTQKEIVDLQTNKMHEELKRFHQGRSTSDLIINYQNDVLAAKDEEVRSLTQFAISKDQLLVSASQLLKPYEDEDTNV